MCIRDRCKALLKGESLINDASGIVCLLYTSIMASIELNILQERELGRLLDYERATCTVDGELVYRCAFPLRPDDDLQRELIERGALAKRPDDRRGTVVAITTDGYSYFPAKRKEQEERNRDKHHDTRLVGLSACFAAACVIIGFLLGRFVG